MTSPTFIADRYELIDDPIRGSMGEVYKAHDTHLDREVAVKLIHRDLLGGDLEPELVRRFQREARLTARAAHPGVPAIHDIGLDVDRHYVVMELVEGATVGDLINEIQPIPIGWTAFIAAQICAVLARTHEISLIHRDLKPDNIMICPDGTVKIVDFGTAIVTDAALSNLTPPGITAGDARYQAPERYLGVATPRSDLFALGHVIHDMLAHHADIPADLTSLTEQLTRHEPQQRPASAIDVHERLTPHIGELPPLPGFAVRPQTISTRMYADLAARLPEPRGRRNAPQPRKTQLTTRQIRTRAENYAADGQYRRAVAILGEAIDAAKDPQDPSLTDLHRDLAAILVDAGAAEQAMTATETAIAALTGRVEATHPALHSLRLLQARAHGAAGDATAAAELYRRLLTDMPAGLLTPDAVAARREYAVQLAIVGQARNAETQLNALLEQLVAVRGHDDPQATAVRASLQLVCQRAQ